MKNCREAAAEWGISERAVRTLCAKGKIPEAQRDGAVWRIPEDAVRPADARVRSGKYTKKGSLPLPVGISDYARAQAGYYYVDKTLFIKEILDRRPLVTLFTRPRRFGKTLNMDMLKAFFEVSETDTSVWFTDKAIWKCGEEYRAHQGIYPVIFLSFKDVKYDTWEMTVSKIRLLLQAEFGRHSELRDSPHLQKYEKDAYDRIVNGRADEVEMSASLEMLSRMLDEHYGTAPVIIIDEYDTPIEEGYSKDFYDEIIGFMRRFFSGAFKDNKHLTFGFLTGILRIAQESLFSGLNNLTVDTVMDREYSAYFGFTPAEVRKMLQYYRRTDKEEELKEWYDGYIFGDTEIYNPWSVINYVAKGCLPQTYWVNTGKNEILEEVLRISSTEIEEKLEGLLTGKRAIARIDQNVVYRSLTEDPSIIYSLLAVAGYLKVSKKVLQGDGTYLCEVEIPNREIGAVYKSEILSHMFHIGIVSRSIADQIGESVYLGDSEKFQRALEQYMEEAMSFYDAGAEGFYHGLVLGLIAILDDSYRIRSNRESGDGRFDICLYPRNAGRPGILMEFKWKKGMNDDALSSYAEEALSQIDDKRYDAELIADGYTEILKFGIAFSGKKTKVKSGSYKLEPDKGAL